MTIAKLEFIKDDARKIGAFIKDAATIYGKRDDYLHMAAGMSFFHAQQHGDPVFIQKFYDALSKGHRNMFRVWLGKLATYTIDDKNDCWLGFKTDTFFVKTGTENIRKGTYEPSELLEMPLFMKREKKEEEEKDADEKYKALLKSLKDGVNRRVKAFNEAKVTIPKDLADLIDKIEAFGK
jgi:hypothetical protein